MDELAARLEALTVELSQELGIEPPVCRVENRRRLRAGIRLPLFGRKVSLFVSRGAMEQLDAMALRWVVAHELGHVGDEAGRRRWQIARRLAGLALLGAFLAMGLAPFPFGHVLAFPLIITSSASALILRRGLERVADRTAHRLCAADPDAGRRALTALRAAAGRRADRLFGVVQAMAGYPPWKERVTPRLP